MNVQTSMIGCTMPQSAFKAVVLQATVGAKALDLLDYFAHKQEAYVSLTMPHSCWKAAVQQVTTVMGRYCRRNRLLQDCGEQGGTKVLHKVLHGEGGQGHGQGVPPEPAAPGLRLVGVGEVEST